LTGGIALSLKVRVYQSCKHLKRGKMSDAVRHVVIEYITPTYFYLFIYEVKAEYILKLFENRVLRRA
jgi:hypothetical protein